MDRAMFVWVGTVGSANDPLSTDAKQNSLITFCGNNGVNVLFLDIWFYLGGSNWSAAHRDTVKKFIATCHASGIRVLALAGNNDWGHNLQWVGKNVVKRIAEFNSAGESVSSTYEGAWFDGVMYDVEYWTVGDYSAQAELPGFLDLMNSTRQALGVPVGCFASQWQIVDGAGQSVTYNGASKLEGYHMMDVADHIAVACYSNNGGGTDGSTQISMMQPWMDYVTGSVGKAGLWCGSETGTGLGNQSYDGETKATMEQNHTAISSQFAVTSSLGFRGQSIDAYSSYSTMS
jgi:hypothetical protein